MKVCGWRMGSAAALCLLLIGCGTAAPKTVYDPAALTRQLDQCLTYGADTAGGSLKNAREAAGLVKLLAEEQDAEEGVLEQDVQGWCDGLGEEQRQTLALNWPGIMEEAKRIIDDPRREQELLTEAGVEQEMERVPVRDAEQSLERVNRVVEEFCKEQKEQQQKAATRRGSRQWKTN